MSTQTRTATARPWLPWLAGAVALGTLIAALEYGHGLDATTITGLPDPGLVTDWALPSVKLLLDIVAVITVGLLVCAAFLLPGDGDSVSPRGYRLTRLVTGFAVIWALCSLVVLVFTVSDILGQPVGELSFAAVRSFAFSISQGQALMIQAALAVVVAVAARASLSRNGVAAAAVLAIIALLPPAFTGHAAGAGNHQIAVTSLALHVAAASVWVGGLVSLLLVRRAKNLPEVASRYSRLALMCFVAVAVSGAANAWVRLGAWHQLFASTYGVLILGKIVALSALCALGAWHRRRTLPALRDGDRRAFIRLAAAEIVVFAATFGLAVALSRSPTPVPSNPADADPLVDVLGFGMPPAPTISRMIVDVLPDMFFLTVVGVGVWAYLAGVWRLRRNGHAWPLSRTISWLGGMVVLAAFTNLGVARYAYLLFSVHMAQHMVLSMLVPILLVGGAPVTLALRALKRPTDPQARGAREWLVIAIHSRFLRFLTHPLVALALYIGSLYGLYMSSALGTLMRYHLGHLAMLTHFVLTGYLLFWTLIGIDPGRRQMPQPMLVLVHFASMAFHAFFGVILLQSTTIIAADWFSGVHPPWAGSLLSDQRLGAGIAWSFGEIPAAIVFGILIMRWVRADEREQTRLDRAAARADASGEEDDLARYNAFLANANAQANADASAGTRAESRASDPRPEVKNDA